MNVVAPHCIASMFTVSPAWPLETAPESVSAPPYPTCGAEDFIESPGRTVTEPRRFVLNASR